MRACSCGTGPQQRGPGAADGGPLVAASLSVVILAREGSRPLGGMLATLSGVLSTLGTEHEIIIVADGLDVGVCAALQQLGKNAAAAEVQVYLLTQQVDPYTAAWRGIENARGSRVAVVDSAGDDVGFLPEMLRRAASGADIVFAQDTDRAPRRLSRAIACRLRDGVQSALGVTSVEHAAPRYRILSQQVVGFIAQHPDPIAAYRRLPAGSSFTRAHLQYGSRARAPRVGPLERAARGTRRLVSRTLDAVTRLQGYDTTFHDPAGGEETICLAKVPVLAAGRFEIAERFRSVDTGTYHPTNPTLARLGQRTWVNVRLVNYRKRGHNSTLSGDGVYRSRNLVFEWDRQTGHVGPPQEASGAPASWAQDTRVRGLEDQRWIVHQGRLWLSACSSQVPHDEGCAKMVLGRMNPALDGVDHLVALRYEAARDAEKNWLLWSLGDQLLAIYGYHPFTLLSLDTDTGRARTFRVHRAGFPARRLRGSAGPVPVPERPGCWLVLVHEVARRFEKPVYVHRWLMVHPDRGMLAYSRPFVFDHVGIEYAAGLLDAGDGTLTVTYGFEDREARWVVLDRARVLASLHAVRSEAAQLAAPHEMAPLVSDVVS